MAVHGTMTAFNQGTEDWRAYTERLDQYFVANEIASEERKRAILLSVCGAATYQLMRDLVFPGKPKDKSYDELVDLMTKHLNPPPSVTMQRYKFNTRKRGKDEPIAEYVAALRQLSEFCEFGDSLDDMLRDRIVLGVNHERLQQKLLAEKELTFAKSLQIARSMETAEKDSQQLKGPNDQVLFTRQRHSKNRQKRAPPPKKPDDPQSGKLVCYRCGGNHLPSTCRFLEAECRACHKKGHIARVCRSRKKESGTQPKPQGTRALYTEEAEEEAGPEEDSAYTMFTVQDSTSPPIMTDVELNGIPVRMEVDTGAAQSIASEETYRKLASAEPGLTLEDVSTKLITYTGECLPILGRVTVDVEVNQQQASLPLVIVAGKGPSLIGRNWLSELRLDWSRINKLAKPMDEGLEKILEKHAAVFRDELGTFNGAKVKVHVKEGARPKFFKPRSVPYSSREALERELQRLIDEGIIYPVQYSEWAAPIVPVVKSNGSIRVCGDYKLTVNQCSHVESYPIPRAEDIFAALSGGLTFTTLDLANAYLQLELDEESKPYLTINTHKGLFRYNRLPFGVSSAPAIFQRTMDCLLQGVPSTKDYIDDIIVTGRSKEEHLKNLDLVLTRLERAGLRLNKSKCRFMADSIEYLGYIIDRYGLHPTPAKLDAIKKARAPTCVTELRAFLGMLNYYGKFLPNLSTVLAPLNTLLCKSTEWAWGKEQKAAFEEAKGLLQSDSLLVHYDPAKKLILECDASPYGIGAVLSHVMEDGSERPIAFSSRTLTTAEKGYSQLDKEGLAILSGVKKFHTYLYGRPFVIRSDHQPLYHLFNEKKAIPVQASARLQRWALTLSAYQYSIQYKPGKLLANADALSRLPTPSTTNSDVLPGELVQLIHHLETEPISAKDVKEWTERDPLLSRVKKFVMSGWPDLPLDKEFQPYSNKQHELSLLEGCLLWGSRLVIPQPGRRPLLEQLHESHLGVSRMKSLARGYFWWPDLNADIEDYVRQCAACQSSRPQPPTAPTHAWDIPKQPWHRLHIDFAGPYMNSMFLVLVDAFSKWVDVVMMKTITSTVTIEKLQAIFATHGLPHTIVSDNGRSFVSDEFQSFCRANGIRHITSSPYHPATNGLAERAVQSFKQGLKRLTTGSLQSKLTRYLFHYRITPHTTTGLSPAEMLMGRRPRSLLDLLHPDTADRLESRREPPSQGARQFKVNDKVYARDFRSSKVKWMPGEIVKVTGPLSYHVRVETGVVRRHVDALRQRHCEDSLAEALDDVLDPTNWPDPVAPTSAPESPAPSSTVQPEAPVVTPPAPVASVPVTPTSPSVPTAATPVGPRRSTRHCPPPNYYRGGS